MEINKFNFCELNGKKLSEIIENYKIGYDGHYYYFVDDNLQEMTTDIYEKLKNNKVYVEEVENDEIREMCHYDFIIKIENSEFELECIFDD